ncbi:MAG TPA: c-type cytochrome [Chitinophagaceae bacterium]|nr:c-type cytochrome [Chitinophagaceae bacterium]
MGLRAARQLNADVINIVTALSHDESAQVRRECAVALHHSKVPEAAALWTELAKKYDGKDRWYLEALGIAADKQWDNFFAAYVAAVKDPLQSDASKNIVWRARTDKAVPYLAKLAADNSSPLSNRLKYFRAFDFNTGNAKYALLVDMIKNNTSNDVALNKVVLHALDIKTVTSSVVAQKALMDVLQNVYGTDEYIELVTRYKVTSQNDKLLQLAIDKPNESVGRDAVGLLLQQGGSKMIWNVINGKDVAQKDSIIIALAQVGSTASVDMVQNIALNTKYEMPLRKEAAGRIGYSWNGEDRVLAILKAKKVPAELIPDVVKSVQYAWRKSVRDEAQSYLPEDAKKDLLKPAPPLADVLALKGNADEGKKIFTTLCSTCHVVNNEGNDFGPKLSEIGSKLPKDALYESIVHPSAGIGFGYEGWELKMKDGSTFSGIFASKTETDIDIKFPGGSRKQLKTADVQSMTQMKQSMMTEGLYSNWSAQDFANLLEYLEGLKKK